MRIERINIGQVILDLVNNRGLTKAQFAKRLGMQRQNIDKVIFKKSSLDTQLLCTISELLEVNLFEFYCNTDGSKELTATLTIELGMKTAQKSFKLLVGKNEIEIN